MEKNYKMSYRQRVIYCPDLDIFNQFLGRGIILGKCACGKRLRFEPHELKSDELIKVERIVRPFRDDDEKEET
jgi:hypothetical protein